MRRQESQKGLPKLLPFIFTKNNKKRKNLQHKNGDLAK